MGSRQQIAATVMMGGLATFVAGIIVALQKDVDHRWGYALIVLGILIVLAGAVIWMKQSPSEHPGGNVADRGGMVNVGNAESVIQQGGQGNVNIYVYLTGSLPVNPDPGPPVLRFGDPQATPKTPLYDKDGNLITNVTLWRVQLENTVEGTKARGVTAELAASAPPLNVLPLQLHKFHDDYPPFTRTHEIRFKDPLILDVIAKRDGFDQFFFWRSDLPEGAGYVYPLSPPEVAAILPALRGKGVVITLKAIPDPPARSIEQDYRLFIDGTDELVMRRMA